MPLLWPWAESSTTTSTWASIKAATRSSTSLVAPMAAPHSRRAALVTGGVGILHSLLNILNGDKALQAHVLVHNGELLNAVAPQDFLGVLQCGAHRRGDQVVLGHHVLDGLVKVAALHKAHVPVGDDAHQHAVLANGHAGNLKPAHNRRLPSPGCPGPGRRG